MRKSRELLLRLYHDPRYRFSEVVVCYIDRGAPGNESCVEGDRIRELDSQYMEIESAVGVSPIPYHRITRVLYGGKPVWERGSRTEDTGKTGD
jgi:hypothetical protein